MDPTLKEAVREEPRRHRRRLPLRPERVEMVDPRTMVAMVDLQTRAEWAARPARPVPAVGVVSAISYVVAQVARTSTTISTIAGRVETNAHRTNRSAIMAFAQHRLATGLCAVLPARVVAPIVACQDKYVATSQDLLERFLAAIRRTQTARVLRDARRANAALRIHPSPHPMAKNR